MKDIEKVIEIKGLNKSYGKKQVLFDIDLEIYQGEIFGLLGVNGAGKTTLLECLEGLRKWENGDVWVESYSPKKNPVKVRSLLGIQLQSSALPEDIKIREAIELFAAEHNVPCDLSILELYDLQDKSNKKYKELSTGQKRRLHLLLALIHDPGIIILDEPSAGLDVEGKISLYNQILSLKEKGKTLLITTHDMQEVERLCDRVAFIVDGRIEIVEEVSNLQKGNIKSTIYIKTRNNSLEKSFEASEAEKKSFDGEYGIWECSNVNQFVFEALQYIMNNDDELIDIYFKKLKLEDIFLSVVKGGIEQ